MNHHSPERLALSDAINCFHDAIDAVQAAQLTLQKAINLQASLLAQREEYALLDEEMADARAQSVKQALANGERPVLDEAPVGFSARRIARDNILTELAAVTETNPLIMTTIRCPKMRGIVARKVLRSS